MTKKRTRHHSRWRIDQDYRQKLSPEECLWLDKFNDEYYRAEFTETPLHPKEKRGEIYDAQNAAQRDLVTASSADVREALGTSVSDRPSLRVRFYDPGDYPFARVPMRQARLEQLLTELVETPEVPAHEVPRPSNFRLLKLSR